MSDSEQPRGYQCEFIDSVPEDLYCKKCNLVARKFTIASCCGESYCHYCITDIQKQGESCPACGEKEYTTLHQIKYKKRINCLQVYCSMKERGCDWSGTLEQLDTHLDPDQDNCQYVDTKCPLNCHTTIPKNKVDQHVAQHCAKRPYVCQHCNFKATYEEVVDTHLTECKYVPLQCPNLCGVTFERDFMEDHMKMCRLEEVVCEFSGVGCDGRFIREDQEEHTRQNSQKHLTLTASLAVEAKEQLQQKLLEQDKKHKEEEAKLKQKIEEQERKLNSQVIEHREEVVQKLAEQKKMLEELFESKLQCLDQKLLELTNKSNQNEVNIKKVSGMIYLFEMTNFSQEKAKDKPADWKSPAMYTHVGGYKFCIGVDANGYGDGRGNSVNVDVWFIPGDYDDQLKWSARAKFTIELINQQERENATSTSDIITWEQPLEAYIYGSFCRIKIGDSVGFIEHSKLGDFLVNDTLHFNVSVEIL